LLHASFAPCACSSLFASFAVLFVARGLRFQVLFSVAVLVAIHSAMEVRADEFKIVPSIALRQEYNTNIFFESKDEVDDFRTTVAPGLEVSQRTERWTYSLSGRLSPYLYWENSDLNATDQDYRGQVDYRATPHLDVGAEAGFRVDQSADRALTTTGLVFDTQKQYRQRYGLNTRYLVNEITSVSLAYSHDRDDPEDDDDLEKMRGHSVNLGLTHHLGRWIDDTIAGLNTGFGYYDYETSKTKSAYLSTGVRSALTEHVNLSLDVGARYVSSDFDAVQLRFVPPIFFVQETVEESNSGWGGIGSAALSYQGLRSGGSVSLSHDIRTGSGTTGPSALTRVSCNAYHRPSAELTLSISSGYFRNRADADEFSADEIDQDTMNLGAQLRYEFARNLALEGGYTFSYINDDVEETESSRHLVFLSLSFSYSLADLLGVLTDMKPGFGSGVVTNPWPEPRL
jgi:hypothetical protein